MKRIAGALIGGVAGWQALAYYTRSSYSAAIDRQIQRTLDDQGNAVQPTMAVGSIEDTVADTLQTGDLVFFGQRCSLKLPCDSLHCALTKAALDSSRFNHVGIVICKGPGLEPYVLEASCGGNVSLRPYSERVLRSASPLIYVHPVRFQRTQEMVKRFESFSEEAVERSQQASVLASVGAIAARVVSNATQARRDRSEPPGIIADAPQSHATALVLDALQSTGLLSEKVSAKRAVPEDLLGMRLQHGAAIRPAIIVRAWK